jgi:hypothetical protein
MKTIYLILIAALTSTLFLSTVHAQSLRGNMKTESSKSLGYANVDIYKGDKKVASVLTDAEGNYNVKLDTGIYRVEMQYFGYDKVVKQVRVSGDEVEDAELSVDEESRAFDYMESEPTDAPRELESRVRKVDAPMGYGGKDRSDFSSESYLPDGAMNKLKYIDGAEGNSKVLTAGEINDFSKWEMWQDIIAEDLNKYKASWEISPQNRFTVQLKNDNGFPIVDAKVELISESGSIDYTSRTDNTGKAELWGRLNVADADHSNYSGRIYHDDQSFEIRKLIPFHRGVNNKSLNIDCTDNNIVDIAFVVDATGSMGDEINFLKKEINDVIYETKNMNQALTFNFANVFYRDQGEAYVTRKQDFSDVLSQSVAFIEHQVAAGGGDYEEAVEIALDTAINSLNWSEKARTRLLFLVLDAPPHNNPEIKEKLNDLMRQAASKGIRIVPLVASGINKDAEYLMRTIALATNGTYAFLTNHSGIGGDHIEPTTDEYDVELLNDLMKRIITSYTFVPECSDDQGDPEVYDSLFVQEDQRQDEIEWSFWPNPTQGLIQIKVDRDIDEIFLTDLTGKILERYTDIRRDRILRRDLAQYPKGIYLLTFALEDKVVKGKVVLQ